MTTRYWFGAAVNVAQIQHINFVTGYVTGDKITLSIPSSGNTKSLILTVGSTATVDQILADLADMVNGASANDDETRSALGSNIGEWADITATIDTTDDLLILTGASDGRPFTVAYSTDSSVGSSIAPIPDNSSVSQGGGDFDNTDNWSGGTVPVDGDDIVFDSQAVGGLKYNILQTSLEPASVTVDSSYRHGIGLPSVGSAGGLGYNEYLDRYLKFGVTTAIDVTIDASQAQAIRIDTNTQVANVVVLASGSNTEAGVPGVLLRGNAATSTYSISGGSVGLWFESGEAGQASAINVASGGFTAPIVTIGDTATLSSCTLTVNSGAVTTKSTVSIIEVNGGTLESLLTAALTTVTVNAGMIYPSSVPSSGDVITTLTIGSAGSLDATRDARAKTIANVSMYPGAKFSDPSGVFTVTNGFDVYGTLNDVSLVIAPRQTYTISAI